MVAIVGRKIVKSCTVDFVACHICFFHLSAVQQTSHEENGTAMGNVNKL